MLIVACHDCFERSKVVNLERRRCLLSFLALLRARWRTEPDDQILQLAPLDLWLPAVSELQRRAQLHNTVNQHVPCWRKAAGNTFTTYLRTLSDTALRQFKVTQQHHCIARQTTKISVPTRSRLNVACSTSGCSASASSCVAQGPIRGLLIEELVFITPESRYYRGFGRRGYFVVTTDTPHESRMQGGKLALFPRCWTFDEMPIERIELRYYKQENLPALVLQRQGSERVSQN